MLKLTYTEDNFHLEYLTQSPEEWVAQRVILAMGIGHLLCVKPSHASFLLPADLPGLEQLSKIINTDKRGIISLCLCDRQYVEVTLWGSWVTDDREEATGIFVTSISDMSNDDCLISPTELLLYNLWLAGQSCASAIQE